MLPRLPLFEAIPLFGLPAIWVGGFIYYVARNALRGGRTHTPRIESLPRSPYLPHLIMEYGYWMFTLPVALFVRLRVRPNTITLGSLALTLGATFALATGHFALGGWTLFVAFMADCWDGIVARKTGCSSPAGEFLDAVVDRYNDLLALLGLMYYYRNDPLPLGLATAALVGSQLVSYTRAKGEAVGVDPAVGYMQRHERSLWLGASLVFAPILALYVEPGAAHPRFHLVVATLALIALFTNITAIWRARFVLDGLNRKQVAS